MDSMDKNTATRIATQLMDDYLDASKGWTFGFDNGKARMGACHHAKRMITLSRTFVETADEAELRGVLLHEIAHALTPGHNHGRVWKAVATAIGCPREYVRASVKSPSVAKRYENTPAAYSIPVDVPDPTRFRPGMRIVTESIAGRLNGHVFVVKEVHRVNLRAALASDETSLHQIPIVAVRAHREGEDPHYVGSMMGRAFAGRMAA